MKAKRILDQSGSNIVNDGEPDSNIVDDARAQRAAPAALSGFLQD